MSEKLIGEVIKGAAYERMRSDIGYCSEGFLMRVKRLFSIIFYSEGKVVNEIFIPEKSLKNCLGEMVQKVRLLAKFVGIEFFEYDARKETKELQERNPDFDVLCDDGYTLVIPTYVDGEKKTPAQKMLEQLTKEYQEQVKKDETEAEQLCKKVLELLNNKKYSIDLVYAWNVIRIIVKVEYNIESSQRHAWKEKVKAIMSENGFDPETYSIRYGKNEWIISYEMTE